MTCWLLLLGLPVTGLLADDTQVSQDVPGTLKKLSLEQLGDIEVTSVSKGPVKVSQTPTAIYVITQEDIRRSGATSIPEALRLAPGVEVAQVDSDHWSIAIRGFAGQFARSLLVLIDGRSVYTPLFSGVYWDVQNLVLEDVDRIEVIRGPGGHHLGLQRGQRRDQHHHQERKRHQRDAGQARWRQRGPRHGRRALWRLGRQRFQLSDLRHGIY